jgi:transcriptional antiterminator NusG
MSPVSPSEANSAAASWYAIHTRSHHERKVNRDLSRQGFTVFLPEYRTLSRRKDRRREILRALFPGYLFVHVCLCSKRRLQILQTESVVRIVGIRHQPVAVPDREIDSVRTLLAFGSDTTPHDSFQPGQLVQVMDGPLSGVVGTIESTPHGKRIIVAVEILGRAVSALIDRETLVPYLDSSSHR